MGFAEHAPVLVSPEEFLFTEEHAGCRREYIGGVVYAMAGGTVGHSLIASNAMLAIGKRVGGPCRALNSDMMVRVLYPTHTRFYYPDVQVVCRMAPLNQRYQDEPIVIVEVLSESTRRTDEQEKRESYLSLPSLQVYVLLEQEVPAATVWRRHATGFTHERWQGLEATVPLPEIKAALPLAEVYEEVAFPAQPVTVEAPGDHLV